MQTPPITRALIFINIAVFLAQLGTDYMHIDLTEAFALHFVLADNFHFWQPLTYMFMHGGWTHLFFNMLSLWMFGIIIERTMGPVRFTWFYLLCGLGAALSQELWQTGQYFVEGLQNYEMVSTPYGMMTMGKYLGLPGWTTVGASGACYGVLLAFGMFYPEERIMMMIPPIPMKAKYFVAVYAVIEVVSAFFSNGSIAHFAHLGGMLVGFLIIKWWQGEPRRRQARWRRDLEKQKQAEGYRNMDYDYNAQQRRNEERLDELLDKVRRSGYDSLSDSEKRELFHISRR